MLKHVGILTSGGDCPGLNAAIRGVGKAARERLPHGTDRLPRRLPRPGPRPHHAAGERHALRHPHQRRDDPGHQPRQAAPDGDRRRGPRHDRGDPRHLPAQPPRRPGLHRRRRHAEERPAAEGSRASTSSPCPRPSTTTSPGPTSPSASTRPWASPPRPSTGCIPRPPATTGSSCVEIMGHRAGWLALGAGIAGGADVILIPEIPYDPQRVAEAIRDRARAGKRFSIVAVAEGAMSVEDAKQVDEMLAEKKAAKSKAEKKKASERLDAVPPAPPGTHRAADPAAGEDDRAGIAADDPGASAARRHALGRRSAAGHPAGTACASARPRRSRRDGRRPRRRRRAGAVGGSGRRKLVPPDHPWVTSARLVGTSFGDSS